MYVLKTNGERLTDGEYESLCRREAKEEYDQWEDPEDWNNNFNDFFEYFMRNNYDDEYDYIPDNKDEIHDIIQDIGYSNKYPQLVLWCDYSEMYDRNLEVTDDQLYKAYEDIRDHEY